MKAPRAALVTGAARGLGLAAARRLQKDGFVVHVVWRSGAAAPTELVREFGSHVHQSDLERPGAAAELVQRVLTESGRIDALVHAVGAYEEGRLDGRVEGGASAAVERMWRSNVATAVAVMDASRGALRSAAHEHGDASAVFFGVAGLEGLRARSECAAYAAAKSALVVLARSWAREEGAHGVRVNCVSPGVVPHDGAHPATLAHELVRKIPLGRVGRPHEIAAAVAWLCSSEATHVTGADLPVAGGFGL
jgi:NAD(P)-dependent dehydrogenase (short-subunit alcohol dehydrogenase family)